MTATSTQNQTWSSTNTRTDWRGRTRTTTHGTWTGPDAQQRAEQHAREQNETAGLDDGTWTATPNQTWS